MSSNSANKMDMSLDDIIRQSRKANTRGGGVIANRRFRGGGALTGRNRGGKLMTRGGRVGRGGLNMKKRGVLPTFKKQSTGFISTRFGKSATRFGRAQMSIQRAKQRLQTRRQEATETGQLRRKNARDAYLMQRRGLTNNPIQNRLGNVPRGRGRGGRGMRGNRQNTFQQSNFQRGRGYGRGRGRGTQTIRQRGGGLFTSGHNPGGYGSGGALAMDLEMQREQLRLQRQARKEPYSERWQSNFRQARGRFGGRRGGRGRGQQTTAASLRVRIPNSYYTPNQQPYPSYGRGGEDFNSRGGRNPNPRQQLLQEARAIVKALSQGSQQPSYQY